MALPTRSNNNSVTSTVSTGYAAGGFVPPTVPTTGTVKVMLLQSMRAESVTPLQKTQSRDGSMKEQPRILMDLVGIYIDRQVTRKDEKGVDVTETKPCLYPDPTGRNPLPSLGSAEYNELMATPSGLWVEALYPGAVEEIEEALEQGVAGFPFSLKEFKESIADGSLNQLLRTQGGFLRAAGFIRKEQWNVAQVIAGSKTIQVSFFNEGEADVYVESFQSLRAHHGFANVAFVCDIGNTMTVSDLSTGPSFTASGVYFEYVQVKSGPGGRTKYTIDPDFTKSGALYGTPVTAARNVSELASRANNANANGAASAVDRRRREREEANKRMMLDGQVTGVPSGMDLV